MPGSALRRFVRGVAAAVTGAGHGDFLPNWTVDATETYANPNSVDPDSIEVSWGSEVDIAVQDQDFTQTTGEITHLGALLKFRDGAPDAFGGCVVKCKPVYAVGETPVLELWTFDGSSWTRRRSVAITNLSFIGTRSGEAKIFDLTLSQQLAGVTKVWVTMAPSAPQGTQLNNWLAIHVYGSCNENVVTPNGKGRLPNPGYPSAESREPECDDLDATEYTCPDPSGTFNFPSFPITFHLNDFLASNFSKALHICPQKQGFALYFGNIPPGGSIEVSILVVGNIELEFTDTVDGSQPAVTTQTISADGQMIWRVKDGTGFGWLPQGFGKNYLPPDVDVILTFAPKGDLSIFQLLDIFLWFFAATTLDTEVC